MIKGLEEFKVVMEFPVLWGQMDAARHVNNTIYLRWAESARIFYFEKMVMDTEFSGDGIGPILGWQDCKYIFPLTYPDTAIVGIKTTEILEDRFMMKVSIFSKKYERISALSSQSIVPYNYGALKKEPLPELWKKKINEIEQKVL